MAPRRGALGAWGRRLPEGASREWSLDEIVGAERQRRDCHRGSRPRASPPARGPRCRRSRAASLGPIANVRRLPRRSFTREGSRGDGSPSVSGADRAMEAARQGAVARRQAHRGFARAFAERCERERRAKVLSDADRFFPPAVEKLRTGRYLDGATTVGGGRTVWKFAEKTESVTVMGDEVTSIACWWFDLERRIYRSGGSSSSRRTVLAVHEKAVPVEELFATLDGIASGQPPQWRGTPKPPPPDLQLLPPDRSGSDTDWPAWFAAAVLAAIAVAELVAILR
jgi:hypothetical protein